jgi:hypothetical protein
MEEHRLILTAKYDGQEMTCPEAMTVWIEPSSLPQTVQLFNKDGQELPQEQAVAGQQGGASYQRWRVHAPAGSRMSGLTFSMLDEAGEQIRGTDCAGWMVKWNGAPPVSFKYVDAVVLHALVLHACVHVLVVPWCRVHSGINSRGAV